MEQHRRVVVPSPTLTEAQWKTTNTAVLRSLVVLSGISRSNTNIVQQRKLTLVSTHLAFDDIRM